MFFRHLLSLYQPEHGIVTLPLVFMAGCIYAIIRRDGAYINQFQNVVIYLQGSSNRSQ